MFVPAAVLFVWKETSYAGGPHLCHGLPARDRGRLGLPVRLRPAGLEEFALRLKAIGPILLGCAASFVPVVSPHE
jgi:hypothetical protein